jgi:hypothetical protein
MVVFNITDETSLYRYPLRLLEALKGEEKKSWDLGYHHATRKHDYSDSDTQDKDAYKRGFEAGNSSRTSLHTSQFQRLRSQKSGSVDGLDSITQQGKLFKTGVPVKFTFVRNTESSPNFGATYGQDIEPAGRYMLHNEDPGDTPGWVSGSIKFNSPLVLKLTMGGSAYGPKGWKARLSRYYGGKKGKALSKAIGRDGYDGIVTIDDGKFRGTAEIVDLTQHRNNDSGTQDKDDYKLGFDGSKRDDPTKFTEPALRYQSRGNFPIPSSNLHNFKDRVSDYIMDRLESERPSNPLTLPVLHGSPEHKLTHISASPKSRQYDNGTSQLGAFFAVGQEDAQHYAGKSGKIYSLNLNLNKPFEMPWSVFSYLQDPTKDEERRSVSSDKWGERLDALRREGLAIRKELERMGHDGVVVRNRRGDILEISSFNDVTLSTRMSK